MDRKKLRDSFLFDMAIDDVDCETMKWLQEQEFYQKWQDELKQIMEKYPCIADVLEGKEEVFLSKEEHKAFVHYLEIEQQKESAERREYYRFGHVHAGKYRSDLEKREWFISKDIFSTKRCGGQESPEYLEELLHRLNRFLTEELRQNDAYQKLKQKENEIIQGYPVVLQLIKGETAEREVTLSVNEQKAIEKFFSLQVNMDSYRELALYKIGQEDLVKYLSSLLF